MPPDGLFIAWSRGGRPWDMRQLVRFLNEALQMSAAARNTAAAQVPLDTESDRRHSIHRLSMSVSDNPRAEIPPGTLEMLILKTLKRFGPSHGYAIAKSIQHVSEDVLRVEEGSLYPALQRILMKGWVTAEWVQAGPKRRSRIYHLTAQGRKQLSAEIFEYRRVSRAIERVIQPA